LSRASVGRGGAGCQTAGQRGAEGGEAVAGGRRDPEAAAVARLVGRHQVALVEDVDHP